MLHINISGVQPDYILYISGIITEFERILSRKFSEVLENTKKAVVLNSKAADVSNEYNVELKKAMDADIDCVGLL